MIYWSSWYRIRSVVKLFVGSVVRNFIIVPFYIEDEKKSYRVSQKKFPLLKIHSTKTNSQI